jgi:type IV secretory pathway VirB10-like protein
MDSIDRANDGGMADRDGSVPEVAPRAERRERQVTMFNRKAIVVLAAIAGMTVMVVSFAFNTPRSGAAGAYDSTARTDLLDGGAIQSNYLSSPPDTARRGSQGYVSSNGERPGLGGLGTMSEGDALPAAVGGDMYDPYAGSGYAAQPWMQDPAPQEPERPSARELAFERAMRCGIRSCPAEVAPVSPAADPLSGFGIDPGLIMPVSYPVEEQSVEPEAAAITPRDRHEAFVRSAGSTSSESAVVARVERPVSPYQIMAGTLIPVTLITAINSDLPGEVVAQVTRNVYDTQQRYLLIPAGSRVLGRVDNQVGLGQARVNIAWHRLILPNNNSLSLPGFGGVDVGGAAGIRDRVNNHYGRTYLNAMLLSAITAGAQLSQPQPANVYAAPSAGQIAAGALGQQMGDVSSEMIRRNMEVGPTLQVRPGFKFSIYVSQDLILPPYDHYGKN